jgi:linoleoyl-CoA desaturase
MHDGNHKAFSDKRWLNSVAGNCLELIGTSAVIYKRSHNYGHHGCVNHLELDRAFDTTYPLLRLHSGLPYAPIHKWQYIYGIFLYGLVNFGDMFGQYDELYWLSNFPVRRGYLSKKAVIMRTFVLIYWFIQTIILPSMTFGFVAAYPVWFVYNIFFGCGYAFLFAVNHWTIKSGFVDFLDVSNNNWGELQVKNSTNFACDSKLWCWIAGGLNYQVLLILILFRSNIIYSLVISIQDYQKSDISQKKLAKNLALNTMNMTLSGEQFGVIFSYLKNLEFIQKLQKTKRSY